MADLAVKSLGLSNPFVIATSPATHGVKAVLKSASAGPGAVTMRNLGHDAGPRGYWPSDRWLPGLPEPRAGRDAL